MARAQLESSSLRFSHSETERLVAVLLLSLALHLGAWGAYEADRKFGWTNRLPLLARLIPVAKKNPQPPPPPVMEPTVFIDVSQADTDAPKQTKYYSNKNSRAANPNVSDANQPKLTGSQKDIPKTEDAKKFSKLQPSAPPQPQPEKSEKNSPATSPENAGDLHLAKPAKENQLNPSPKPERPRTVQKALAQRSPQLPGVQMQQDGGVKRHAVQSSLDARATPFGEYDRAIVEAVTQRWYDLLDSRRFAQDRTGKVTLRFKLKADGGIQDLETLENTVGQMLGYVCQDAVQEAAPFGKWPADMTRMVGANFREITFTFYYY